jgi:hypothetical protein
MGLDMYAFTVAKGQQLGEGVQTTELAYWRKFNALHGWMEDLYRNKGGDAESFNCIPVHLTENDLDELQRTVSKGLLKPREGFFFGAQQIYPEDVEETLTFIKNAREAIADGKDVYYDSWW